MVLSMKSFKTFFNEAATTVFNTLKIPDLRKDENRVLNFISKVEDGSPFSTVSKGSEVIIDKDQLDAVKAFMLADDGKFPAKATSMQVKTNKGNLTIPKDFLKTGDFGGRGQGSGTSAETMAMNFFNKGLVKILEDEGLPQIKLKINGRIVDCAAMVKTEGKYQGREPKSDMTIVDAEGNPQAYISHKAGSSAKDYQQYGGLSYKEYINNRDIKKFMQDVNKERPDGLQSGDSFYRTVKDNKLICQAMYGPEFGGKPSISNVDEFHLGNMILKGKGKGPYHIESTHKGVNGDIPNGQYEAVFFVRFQARRGDARAAGEVIKNARVGIFPIAKTSRTSIKI
jgi:hypothetical protein